jgi:hypothetical protein
MPFSQLENPKQEQNYRYEAEDSFHVKNIVFTPYLVANTKDQHNHKGFSYQMCA